MGSDETHSAKRVLVLGATGTIGRASVDALVRRGHAVTCFVRPSFGEERARALFAGAEVRFGEVTSAASLREHAFADTRFDAVVCCLASRSGRPADAWEIDHRATADAIEIARERDVAQFVLLSAICVQKPRLQFQHAKLAAEQALIESGMDYSIVRPTAFFKSLSGQVERVRRGKPYLLFGDGTLTACKPISDADLGRFLCDCLDDPALRNRILPIGGPGPAITPREQGERLFALTGRPPRFRQVPVALLDVIIGSLGVLGRIVPALTEKAEFARIARYYATESMLVLDPETGRYDADATPSTGSETLFDYYAQVLGGDAKVERGEHSVF